MKRKRILMVVGGLILLTSCNVNNNRRGLGDAPIEGRDDSPARIYNFPDQFPNVATKCVGDGWRAFVVTHAKSDPPPVIVADKACAKTPS